MSLSGTFSGPGNVLCHKPFLSNKKMRQNQGFCDAKKPLSFIFVVRKVSIFSKTSIHKKNFLFTPFLIYKSCSWTSNLVLIPDTMAMYQPKRHSCGIWKNSTVSIEMKFLTPLFLNMPCNTWVYSDVSHDSHHHAACALHNVSHFEAEAWHRIHVNYPEWLL